MKIEPAINLIHHGADARSRHANASIARVELNLEFVLILLRDHGDVDGEPFPFWPIHLGAEFVEFVPALLGDAVEVEVFGFHVSSPVSTTSKG